MSQTEIASQFVALSRNVKTETELFQLMEDVTTEIGFCHFALINHVDLRRPSKNLVRLYNYPLAWVERFVEEGLHAHDPVLLASLTTAVGFLWADVPKMINITKTQRTILENASRHGLGDGFTVPAHIPGDFGGSCSFATRQGVLLRSENLLLAQLVGAFGFEAARRLNGKGGSRQEKPLRLTPRQRDCLLWAIKGKTDWEIGHMLGLKEETVTEYLNSARQRYGVTKRLPLAVHAIFDGHISFIEALS